MIEAKGPDIIVGDFNIDAYQESRYHIYWQVIHNLLTLQHILQDQLWIMCMLKMDFKKTMTSRFLC